MGFNWFFKGFRKYPGDVFLDDDATFENSLLKEDDKRDPDNSLIDPFEKLEDASQDLFQHMDIMLNRMFSFGSGEFFQKSVPSKDPRSFMLKEKDDCEKWIPYIDVPYEENKRSLMIDSDIDKEIAQNGIFIDEMPRNKVRHNFSFKRSIRSVLGPDGTMEEHHTFTDSDGNTTTTVRRLIGNQSYEVITHSDSQGLKEKNENFINLDKNDLVDFEKRWRSVKDSNRNPPALDDGPKKNIPTPNPPPGDASYLFLFKKFFGV